MNNKLIDHIGPVIAFLAVMAVVLSLVFILVITFVEPNLLYIMVGGIIALIAAAVIAIPMTVLLMKNRESDRQEFMAMIMGMNSKDKIQITTGIPNNMPGPSVMNPQYLEPPPPERFKWLEEPVASREPSGRG